MADQDIFESVEREVVGELADQHEGDQPRAGDPSRYRLGGHRRAGHAVAALRAGVLGQDVDRHFELRRDEFELAGEVLADALFRAAAAGAGLLGLGQVVLDADVGEMVERGSPPGACRLGRLRRRRGVGLGGRARFEFDSGVVEIEQMTLVRVVEEAFAAGAEDIAAKQGQRLGQLGVFFLQLAVVGRGRVEHALEFGDAAPSVFGLPLSVSAWRPASSACCRNSSLRRSRSRSNCGHCSGSSGRRGVTLIT